MLEWMNLREGLASLREISWYTGRMLLDSSSRCVRRINRGMLSVWRRVYH